MLSDTLASLYILHFMLLWCNVIESVSFYNEAFRADFLVKTFNLS